MYIFLQNNINKDYLPGQGAGIFAGLLRKKSARTSLLAGFYN